jgi:hypothetical protein
MYANKLFFSNMNGFVNTNDTIISQTKVYNLKDYYFYFLVLIFSTRYTLKKTKLRGRSPQANYTDRATAACRRSKGCCAVSATNSHDR